MINYYYIEIYDMIIIVVFVQFQMLKLSIWCHLTKFWLSISKNQRCTMCSRRRISTVNLVDFVSLATKTREYCAHSEVTKYHITITCCRLASQPFWNHYSLTVTKISTTLCYDIIKKSFQIIIIHIILVY